MPEFLEEAKFYQIEPLVDMLNKVLSLFFRSKFKVAKVAADKAKISTKFLLSINHKNLFGKPNSTKLSHL